MHGGAKPSFDLLMSHSHIVSVDAIRSPFPTCLSFFLSFFLSYHFFLLFIIFVLLICRCSASLFSLRWPLSHCIFVIVVIIIVTVVFIIVIVFIIVDEKATGVF